MFCLETLWSCFSQTSWWFYIYLVNQRHCKENCWTVVPHVESDKFKVLHSNMHDTRVVSRLLVSFILQLVSKRSAMPENPTTFLYEMIKEKMYLQIQISHPEVFYWSKREARVGSLLNVKHSVKECFLMKKWILTSFMFNDLRNQENTQCTAPRLKMTYPLPQVSLSSDVPLTTTHCVPPHVSSAHPPALPKKSLQLFIKIFFCPRVQLQKKKEGNRKEGEEGAMKVGERGGRGRQSASHPSLPLLYYSSASSPPSFSMLMEDKIGHRGIGWCSQHWLMSSLTRRALHPTSSTSPRRRHYLPHLLSLCVPLSAPTTQHPYIPASSSSSSSSSDLL